MRNGGNKYKGREGDVPLYESRYFWFTPSELRSAFHLTYEGVRVMQERESIYEPAPPRVSKLSKKERSRLFAKEAPEFAAVVEDFGEKMLEAAKILAPVAEAIDRGDIPQGRMADYIKLKYEVVLR